MRWFTLLLIGCVSVQAAGAVINVPADHLTIQGAIAAAVNGDEIIVQPGTYVESIDFLGKAITVRSTDPNDIGVVLNTIIDGTGFDHVVQCISGEGPGTVLSGFVITGGNANGGGFGNVGGGMLIINSSPTVTNTGFCNNTPDAITGDPIIDGGGVSLLYCPPPPIPVPASCPADINSDTNVNVTDLLALLGAWGACP